MLAKLVMPGRGPGRILITKGLGIAGAKPGVTGKNILNPELKTSHQDNQTRRLGHSFPVWGRWRALPSPLASVHQSDAAAPGTDRGHRYYPQLNTLFLCWPKGIEDC
jgi:hypothetical protein